MRGWVEKARKRLAKITPGPWHRFDGPRPGIEASSVNFSIVVFGEDSEDDDDCGVHGRNPVEQQSNADFIIAARNDEEWKLTMLEEARALLSQPWMHEGPEETEIRSWLKRLEEGPKP